MALNTITIVLNPADGVEITNEMRLEIARDAAADILRKHGRLGYEAGVRRRRLESVRTEGREWETVRYPGEDDSVWAVTQEELDELREDEYDEEDEF